MPIRRASKEDIGRINELLHQVLDVHHKVRPDIFKPNAKKYTNEELLAILEDESRPIFVADDNGETVVAYAFCVFIRHESNNILTDIKTLYIDDLCVDKCARGRGIGTKMLDFVKDYAREIGCYNVTLNVWACNPGALKFYEKCGMQVQKMGMEWVL